MLTHDAAGLWSIVGTGFYISADGLFVTAAHVIDQVMNYGVQVRPLFIVHFHSDRRWFGASEVLFRPIGQCWLADTADIAFGVAATATNNRTGERLMNWYWGLDWSIPAKGSPIATYAFPKHSIPAAGELVVFPDAYSGFVRATADYRDSVLIPYPYVEIDLRIHGGASGGPLFVNGRVIGVNTREMDGQGLEPSGPAFGAQIRCLRGAFIENAAVGLEDFRTVTFDALVSSDAIAVHGYEPASSQTFGGHLVRLDMPSDVSRPRMTIVQRF